jgi:hypothetical protein
VRSGTATTRRLVIALSVAAAVTVMIGAILIAASVVMRMVTKHQPAHMTRLGLDVVAAGIAFGLVVFAIGRIGGAGRSRPRAGRADHRRGAPRPEPAASRGHGGSRGHGKDRAQTGSQRASAQQASTQQAGAQRGGAQRGGAPSAGGHAGRDGGARSGRPPVLNPTNVYSPGGLIDMPGDGRAPGTPGGQDIPEILRTAGPGPAPGGPVPGAQTGGRGQDRPPSGWAGPQPPRPGYQPGMNPGGPGWPPHGPGGQPGPMPPHDRGRPREAPRAGYPAPGRDGAPGREPFPPRGAGPGQNPRDASRPGQAGPRRDPGQFRDPRDQGRFRDQGRDSMGPGGPFRPGGPVPPRDPAYPPPYPPPGPGHAQDRGAGPHAAGPGYGAPGYAGPGGPRPGGPGHAGAPGYRGQADGDAPFDGGYAKVIRASDHPVRPAPRPRPPGFGRPAEPARPAEAPADVYVYRDTGDQPGGPAATGRPGDNDAAYWYDLPGSAAGTAAPPQGGEEARGPFEPLVSSSDPPGAGRPDTGRADEVPEDAGAGGVPEESAYDRARKLEQIRDLYLTAEAIGAANVDKHFDQLLAQQRELISDYFRQPGPAGSAAGAQPDGPDGLDSLADQAETAPGARRDPGPSSRGPRPGTPLPGTRLPGGPATPPEGVGVAADQPRAW